MTQQALEELGVKYREMLAMRLAHDAGDETAARARLGMARLAARFPGALREIDELELHVIRDRIRQLDDVARGTRPAEPWMNAVAMFHALARGALWAKRWLAGRKQVDPAMPGEYERVAAARCREALAWTAQLEDIAAPPGGRIVPLIVTHIAAALGTSDADALALVFGEPKERGV